MVGTGGIAVVGNRRNGVIGNTGTTGTGCFPATAGLRVLAVPGEPAKAIAAIAAHPRPGIYASASRPLRMDRDLDLRIKGHLYELGTVNDDILGTRQGFHAAEQGYTSTLESVADCAGTEMVDRVAETIKEHIREREERPTNQSVRREARTMLSEEGFVVDGYLNKA